MKEYTCTCIYKIYIYKRKTFICLQYIQVNIRIHVLGIRLYQLVIIYTDSLKVECNEGYKIIDQMSILITFKIKTYKNIFPFDVKLAYKR